MSAGEPGIWGELHYFSQKENWGAPDLMDKDFLYALDAYRGVVGFPCHLTAPAYAKEGHAAHSFHYQGRAADLRFVDPETEKPLSLADHILIAIRAPFLGVGIYTWAPGGPFLHFDHRQTNRKILWTSETEDDYQNLSLTFLKKYVT